MERLRKLQILNDSGAEESAIVAYLASDSVSVDQYQVGILERHNWLR